jgi:hypothetical protein
MPVPILHEDVILQNIHPSMPLAPDGLRICLKFILSACSDRQLTHEGFLDIAEQVTDTMELLTRMETTGLCKYAIEKSGGDTPSMAEAIAGMQKELIAKRLGLVEKFSLVMQCPVDKLEVN